MEPELHTILSFLHSKKEIKTSSNITKEYTLILNADIQNLMTSIKNLTTLLDMNNDIFSNTLHLCQVL